MRRNDMTSRLSLFAGVLAVVLVTIALRAPGQQGQQSYSDPYFPGILQSKTEVIAWEDSVARFDTTTGAIYRLRGDVSKPNVRNYWELVVQPVRNTSGRVQIQKAQGPNISTAATFLVDQVTGDTWILHRRAIPNGTWNPIVIK